MRILWIFGLSAGLALAAQAGQTSDRAPIDCAWDHLSPAEQSRLKGEFGTEKTRTNWILNYSAASVPEVEQAMRVCQLSFQDEQFGYFRLALGRKAAEMLARWAIDERGAVKSEVVDKALARMHAGKRAIIGDALSCTRVRILGEWDGSILSAMRQARITTVDGRSVALVSIAMLSVFAQEGYMRRIAGTAASCEGE